MREVHIVDDEPELRASLGLLLSTAQVSAVGYESAEAFLASGAFARPVCLLLDNRMRGLSGLDLLKQLRERGSPATVVVMTGHADIPTAVAAMKLGAFHFLEKPFDGEGLLAVVEEALLRAKNLGGSAAEPESFSGRRKSLTQREAEVFELLLEGLPTKTIAARLDITARTAEHHRAAVMRKLEARSISHLIRMALDVKVLESKPPQVQV